jgi:hypothetical protein
MIAAASQPQVNHFQKKTSLHLVDFNLDQSVHESQLFVEKTNLKNVKMMKEVLHECGPFTKDDLLDIVYFMFEQENLTAVSTLVQLYPNISSLTNRQGQIPLHVLTCWSRLTNAFFDPSLVQIFVREGIRHQVGGPRGAGGLYLPDHSGLTPIQSLLLHAGQCGPCVHAWESLAICVEAAFQKRGEGNFFPVLHESVGLLTLRKFKQVVEVVRRFDPNLVGVNEREHDILIHIIWLSVCSEKEDDGDDENEEITLLDENDRYQHIKVILESGSTSYLKKRDQYGRLALSHAITNNIPIHLGLSDILLAYPEAISSSDGITSLYPFQLAAADAKTYGAPPINDLNSIYFLLREDPTALSQ